jgi:hypothetical protein
VGVTVEAIAGAAGFCAAKGTKATKEKKKATKRARERARVIGPP